MTDTVFSIKLISEDFASGADTAKGKKGGKSKEEASISGSLMGIGTKIGGIAAIAGAIQGIIADGLGNILKPIRSVLVGIVKMLAEFLRPIVDIVVILLRPILSLVKPLLVIFKAMMAPFINIARQMGQMAQQQAAQGNMTGALELAIAAFQTIAYPFVITITSIALQLFVSAIMGVFGAIANVLIGGIQTIVVAIVDIFAGPDTVAKVNGFFESWKTDVATAATSAATGINSSIQSLTTAGLNELLVSSQSRLDEFKVRFGTTMGSVFSEQVPGSTASEIVDGAAAINASVTQSFDAMKSAGDSVYNAALNTFGVNSESGGSSGTFTSLITSAFKTLEISANSLNERLLTLSSTMDSSGSKSSRGGKRAGIVIGGSNGVVIGYAEDG